MRHTFLLTGSNATVILSIVVSIILSAGKGLRDNYSHQNFFEARWTGTITLDEKYVGLTGTSDRHVSVTFSNALPTLFRDDETTNLDFTDDKGTGTATYHGEVIIAGKKMGATDCQGSGKAELHEVVVDETENNYEIMAIGPACTGTSVSYVDASKVEPYGPEYTDLIISDQPLTANHDVLAGSKSNVIDLGGDLGTVTKTITWNLVKTINRNVELIVIPAAYDTWLPEAGLNELVAGNEMSLSLKLQAIGGGPTTLKAKVFELKLTNTSREPGVTINYPLIPGDPMPDLRFQVQTNAEINDEFQSLKISCPAACQTTTFKIGSFDGGGYSTLTAVAILQDGSRIQGKLTGPAGTTEITIPKRDPNSNIGKAWLMKYNNPGETDDQETTNSNSNNGDGLTAYEEYRGVITKSKYKKLDPTKKELGVKMKKAEISLFDQGNKLLESAANILVIPFFEEEIGQDRRLNKNYLTAHNYDQYVEYLVKGRLQDDAMGENQPTNVTAKILKNSDRVVIDVDKINSAYQSSVTQLNAANRRYRSNIRMPYTAAEDIANTVAHELAHGLGIDHHGIPSMDPLIPQIPEHSVDIYHVYDSYGLEITTRPLPMGGLMGKKGNDESGDLHCIMAYTSLYQWAFRYNGRDGSLNYYAVPLLAPGRILCADKTGRGMKIPANLIAMGFSADDNYFGEASNGNCISRMKLRN